MKRIVLILFLCVPCLLWAGIIVTKDDGNIEDVTNITIGTTEIFYKQDGQLKSINRDKVSAILHDNGRYEEIRPASELEESNIHNGGGASPSNDVVVTSNSNYISEDNRAYNVFAFGTMAMNFYVRNDKYDGARVEWRIISKTSAVANTEFQYLGTTPFAYVTSNAINSVESMYKGAQGFIQENPLIIDGMTAGNSSKVKIEFRVTKEGYEPLIVAPIRKIDFTGLYLMLPLNKLKPIKGVSTATAAATSSVIATGIASLDSNSPENSADITKNNTDENNVSQKNTQKEGVDQQTEKRMIPQICYTEGKNVYDAVYKEGQIQAMRRGYSKSQAISIAGEFAEQAKKKAIDECYEAIVVHDEEFKQNSDSSKNNISYFDIYDLSSSAKQIIPQACIDEGKKAYDFTFTEAEAKALRQGYSKSQAKTLASEAAEKAKKKAIDECYDKVVNQGNDYYNEEDITASSEVKDNVKDKDNTKKNKEDKRFTEERKKHEADSIKAAKEANKISVKKQESITENESSKNEKRMLLGLSFGVGIPIAQWYRQYDDSRYDGYSFGFDGQVSFDIAFPISQKFAMGLYIAGGGGLAFRNEYVEVDRDKHIYTNNRANYKATTGLLMIMGDFANKGAFMMGLGAGYGQVGEGFMDPIIPVEIRLGGVFKKGFYFSIDATISPINLTLYNNFYIEPSIRFGYNFGNLITLNKTEK